MDKKPGKGASKKAGMAPFASLEDLSDDSPPDDKSRLTLPGIKEDQTMGHRNITPRIDISRASSSSHQDDSSPERELFAVEGGAKIGLGFSEEMAQELRSSTEELDFHGKEDETKTRRKKLHQQHAVAKYELEAQSDQDRQERKDSACSESGLLLIGGRTSRLSSVGSVASGNSVASHVSGCSGISHLSAASRFSGQSHLSAISNNSKASRCSSPHRMLLETSFCGPKPIPTLSLEAEYPPSESVEAALLARKSDITGAILPDDIPKNFSGKNTLEVKTGESETRNKPSRSHSERVAKPTTSNVQPRSSSTRSHRTKLKKGNENELIRIIPLHYSLDDDEIEVPDTEPEPKQAQLLESNKPTRSHSERVTKTIAPVVQARSSSAKSHKPKIKKGNENDLIRIIPLHYSLDDDEVEVPDTEAVEAEPEEGEVKEYMPENGIYIPLKGPIIDTKDVEEVKEANKSKKPNIEESDLVRFISLHGEDDEEIEKSKKACRNGQNVQFKPWTEDVSRERIKKSRSPEPLSKSKPTTLEISPKFWRPAKSMTQLPRDESRTPSPAASFARGVLFRRSSDSSSYSKKSTNSSGSTESKSKKDSRNKSMFSSLFKKNVKETPTRHKPEKPSSIDPKITNVEFKFKQEDVEAIIIPLHSPDSIVEPCILYEPDAIVPAEVEEKACRNYKKEAKTKYREIVSPDVTEDGKKIVVVDVIKEDTKSDKVISEPEPPKIEAQEKVTDKLELENLEYEPRVRKSISSMHETDKEELISSDIKQTKIESCSIKSKSPSSVFDVACVMMEKQNDKKSSGSQDKTIFSKSPSIALDIAHDVNENKSEDKFKVQSQSSLLEEDRTSERELLKSQASSRDTEVEDRRSSVGSEIDVHPAEPKVEECDEERKVLFVQADSVDDDLPYVPTTLPQERSVALPIVPVRQRVTEVRTCPVDRPRSTTPIQPANLEEYAASHESTRTRQEKMQITLPRTDLPGKSKSPGKPKPWTQFAEECLLSPKETRKAQEIASSSPPQPSTPPPLPPKGSGPAPQWVMFDEQPEKRKAPKRITTLPVRHAQPQTSSSVVYSYVNPEECSCECHESQGIMISAQCLSETEHCSYKKGSRTEKEKRYRT